MHSSRFLSFARMKAPANSERTPPEVFVDDFTDLGLQHFHFPGQIDRDLALLTVHRTEFHRNLKAVLGAIPAPISRHRFHRFKYAKFRFFTRIKYDVLETNMAFPNQSSQQPAKH